MLIVPPLTQLLSVRCTPHPSVGLPLRPARWRHGSRASCSFSRLRRRGRSSLWPARCLEQLSPCCRWPPVRARSRPSYRPRPAGWRARCGLWCRLQCPPPRSRQCWTWSGPSCAGSRWVARPQAGLWSPPWASMVSRAEGYPCSRSLRPSTRGAAEEGGEMECSPVGGLSCRAGSTLGWLLHLLGLCPRPCADAASLGDRRWPPAIAFAPLWDCIRWRPVCPNHRLNFVRRRLTSRTLNANCFQQSLTTFGKFLNVFPHQWSGWLYQFPR